MNVFSMKPDFMLYMCLYILVPFKYMSFQPITMSKVEQLILFLDE